MNNPILTIALSAALAIGLFAVVKIWRRLRRVEARFQKLKEAFDPVRPAIVTAKKHEPLFAHPRRWRDL